MKRNLLIKACIYVFVLLLMLFTECLMSAFIYERLFIKYPLIEISSLLIALSPMFIFKKHRNSIIYISVFYIVFLAIVLMNLLLDFASSDIFSWKYIFLAGEAAKVVNMQYIHIGFITLVISLALFYFVGIKFIYMKLKKADNEKYMYHPVGYSIILCILCAAALIRGVSLNTILLENESYELYDNKNANEIILYSTDVLKKSSLKNYGLLTYNYAEIKNILSYVDEEELDEEIEDYFNSGEAIKSSEFTGLLEGMNVITIMIETGIPLALNEVLTPNLYKLNNEGLTFNNNYSKNKTNVSELIGILGSTSESVSQGGYYAPYSVPQVLKDMGYKTTYVHDNTHEFYNRSTVLPTLGFDNLYFIEDVNPEDKFVLYDGNYPLDSNFMKKANEIIAPDCDEPFYTFWTTLSTHGPYNTGHKNMKYFKEIGYYDLIEECEANGTWVNPYDGDSNEVHNQIKNYVCEMMDFDTALGILLERLEKIGELDNTLLVLYGDHDIYYRSNFCKPLKNYIYNVDDETLPIQYETIMTMYNPLLAQKYKEVYGKTSIDYFTSPYIIAPTIVELMGVNYNTNHYMGKSIFQTTSDFDNIFYSHELKMMFTDKIYCDDITEFSYCEADEEYIDSFSLAIYDVIRKVRMFNRIYSNEYFKIEE